MAVTIVALELGVVEVMELIGLEIILHESRVALIDKENDDANANVGKRGERGLYGSSNHDLRMGRSDCGEGRTS